MECDINSCELLKLKDDFGLVQTDSFEYDRFIKDAITKKYFSNRFVLYRDNDNSGFGKLYLRGVFVCDTLENPTYLIPRDSYDISWTYSPKFKKFTYEVVGVPNRQGIRFHSGNLVSHSKGCILCGVRKGGVLQYSEITIDRFNVIGNECKVNSLIIF